MTLTADQANKFTNDTIANNSEQDVTTELQRTENQIRSRIGQERFELSYNAEIIGNPAGDPIDDTNLTPEQIVYRDHWLDDGYKVGIDINTGNWALSWATVGAELLTMVYSTRTTVTPGAVSDDTISVIDNFFENLDLRATSRTVLVDKDPSVGGDIPESDFGAPDSTFYEYLSVVQQQDDTDNSADLKAALRASGLGYVDDTRVTGVGGATNTTSSTNTLDVSNGTTTETVTVGGTGTAQDLVDSINNNSTLQSLSISADINGADIIVVNELAGTLTLTNNTGDVLGDIFGLSSPQSGVLTDNTEVYLFA